MRIIRYRCKFTGEKMPHARFLYVVTMQVVLFNAGGWQKGAFPFFQVIWLARVMFSIASHHANNIHKDYNGIVAIINQSIRVFSLLFLLLPMTRIYRYTVLKGQVPRKCRDRGVCEIKKKRPKPVKLCIWFVTLTEPKLPLTSSLLRKHHSCHGQGPHDGRQR